MSLSVGAKLGPYQILGRDAAVKILPESFARDEDRMHRFEQEARAVAALNYTNVLAIYHTGSLDGVPYLASELLDGESPQNSARCLEVTKKLA
jgi:serine/threonine protein kinase